VISVRGNLSENKAQVYAGLITRHSRVNDIDPYLVAALIHRESRWNSNAVSKRNYGLMQIRVSRTTHARFIGQEQSTLNAETNIRLGVSLLAFWKRFHITKCKSDKHHWWSHYQWGVSVKDPGSGNRVAKEYARYLSWLKKLKVGLTLPSLKLQKRDEV
jgi:hypothetical protein